MEHDRISLRGPRSLSWVTLSNTRNTRHSNTRHTIYTDIKYDWDRWMIHSWSGQRTMTDSKITALHRQAPTPVIQQSNESLYSCDRSSSTTTHWRYHYGRSVVPTSTGILIGFHSLKLNDAYRRIISRTCTPLENTHSNDSTKTIDSINYELMVSAKRIL
jgi:hypothetical protein